MAEIDKTTVAADALVAEVAVAVERMKELAAANNDTKLQSIAERLTAAAAALHAVDQPPADPQPTTDPAPVTDPAPTA